jgi:hypothetical protein
MFARRNESDLRGRPGLQDQLREALRDRRLPRSPWNLGDDDPGVIVTQ